MDADHARAIYRFGDFECDAGAYELRRMGRRVALARQPMDLLMLRRPGELVSRDEIAANLWGDGVFVDVEGGIRTAVLEVRDALGDSGSLDVFVGPRATDGRADEAARPWGASDALLESVGGSLVPTIAWIRDRCLEPAAGRLGRQRFERARAEGRQMALEEAMTLAFGSPTDATSAAFSVSPTSNTGPGDPCR